MSSSLNVIALISGGKDSFFSLLHCVQNGHRVVALANLYPSSQPQPESLLTDRLATTGIGNAEALSHEESVDASQDVELEGSDINSFMYQTVGHSLIPLYSTVLQLPLYRQQITGSSIQLSQYYDTSVSIDGLDAELTSDETEDLIPLLRQVISAHPEANAVSTGAILSTYQRTRIESIAIRLGLTPLSFLWQYPVLPPPLVMSTSTSQVDVHRPDSLTGLLEDIAVSGLDARIIKIASAGVSESLLFASIADTRVHARLVNGLAPFFDDDDEISLRGAVLGEGGEYETIALNGPREIWKGGRIEIDEDSNGSYSDEGVSYVKFGKAKVVPHDEGSTAQLTASASSNISSNLVPIPGLLDHRFEAVKKALHNVVVIPGSKPSDVHVSSSTRGQHQDYPETLVNFTVTSTTITVNNLTSKSISKYLNLHNDMNQPLPTPDPTTASDQLRTILSHLSTILAKISQQFKTPSLNTTNISSTTILLRNISDFASVNPIYSQIYPRGLPNPPARVTIASPLSPNIQISLSLVLDLHPQAQRRGLHVQGRSYWAPANIGPYSQAIAVPLRGRNQQQDPNNDELDEDLSQPLEIVHIAGQIPLVPSSMEVHSGPFLDTAILSLQHLWRIGQERGVDTWPWAVAYLSQDSSSDVSTQAHIAAAVWHESHLQSTWSHHLQSSHVGDSNSDSENGDTDVDVWDIQHNRSQHHGFRHSKTTLGKHLHLLPNHDLFQSNQPRQRHIPPFLAAEITSLPRNVSIEWWSTGLAKFISPSGQKAVRLNWQTQRFSWGSLSSLHITDLKRKTLFISCLILADPAVDTDGVPTNLPEMMRLIDNNDSGADHPPLPAQVVQGMMFTTTSPLQSHTWTKSTSPSSARGMPESPMTQPQLQPQPLSDQTVTIPCYSLWGRAATSVPVSASRRKTRTQSADVGGGSTEHDALLELKLAFLLRVEVDVH